LLAEVFFHKGDFESSQQVISKARKIVSETCGAMSLECASFLLSEGELLAKIAIKQNNSLKHLKAAIKCFNACVEKQQSVVGDSHPFLQPTYEKLIVLILSHHKVLLVEEEFRELAEYRAKAQVQLELKLGGELQRRSAFDLYDCYLCLDATSASEKFKSSLKLLLSEHSLCTSVRLVCPSCSDEARLLVVDIQADLVNVCDFSSGLRCELQEMEETYTSSQQQNMVIPSSMCASLSKTYGEATVTAGLFNWISTFYGEASRLFTEAGAFSQQQFDAIKQELPRLKVRQLGTVISATDLDMMEAEYAQSQLVKLPAHVSLPTLSAGCVSELSIIFQQVISGLGLGSYDDTEKVLVFTSVEDGSPGPTLAWPWERLLDGGTYKTAVQLFFHRVTADGTIAGVMAGMLSVEQVEVMKAQCPQLKVAHLGAAITAAEYAAVEHGYKESKQVVLTGIEGLAGRVSDGAVSELCGVFAEMEGLFTTPGVLVCSTYRLSCCCWLLC
jgi:hypothetical protein